MALDPKAVARADAAIRRVMSEIEDLVVDPARADVLLDFLEQADRDLGVRLAEVARRMGTTERFSGASLQAYRRQVQMAATWTRGRLGGMTRTEVERAMRASIAGTGRVLAELEMAFRGVALPLRMREALSFSGRLQGVRASMLRGAETSVDRYGMAMIREFERVMATGMMRGASNWDLVQALTAHGGPRGTVSMAAIEIEPGLVHRLRTEQISEGLFVRHRYWAERIVRTETASAYNAVRLDGLYAARGELGDVQKKILAHFDNRTAADSVAVHGQIRELEAPFVDGAGRVYQRPPARPNDRETIIPWRSDWPETPVSAPPPPRTVSVATRDAGDGLARPRAIAVQRAQEATARAQVAAGNAAAAPIVPAPVAPAAAANAQGSPLSPSAAQLQRWAIHDARDSDTAGGFTMASTRDVAEGLGMSPRRAYALMARLEREHPGLIERGGMRVDIHTGEGARRGKRGVGWELWNIMHAAPVAAAPEAAVAFVPETRIQRVLREQRERYEAEREAGNRRRREYREEQRRAREELALRNQRNR